MKKEIKLAKIWCSLNRYEWPKEIKNPMPQLFTQKQWQRSYASPLMELIEIAIGKEACLIEWRKQHNINLTIEEE